MSIEMSGLRHHEFSWYNIKSKINNWRYPGSPAGKVDYIES